jgi:S-adenosylmethionine hydrolase
MAAEDGTTGGSVVSRQSSVRYTVRMSRPIVALLSDFGTKDHYVGTMKGAVLSVCPDATLVDIGHEITPHDVLAGALELAAAYRYFPSGTVFLVVVDPGVGSTRRGLAAEAGDYRFVAPDNGVLSAVFRELRPKKVVDLTERKYARATVSKTFEGRDRFAPAAGWLAKGVSLSSLGRALSDPHLIDIPAVNVDATGAIGEVLRVDRFGNLITNIDRATFDRLTREGSVSVRIADHDIPRVINTYAESPAGAVCALFGSTDHLEIAVNGGSAAETLRLVRGARVTVTRHLKTEN